jgi:hypothetical protein
MKESYLNLVLKDGVYPSPLSRVRIKQESLADITKDFTYELAEKVTTEHLSPIEKFNLNPNGNWQQRNYLGKWEDIDGYQMWKITPEHIEENFTIMFLSDATRQIKGYTSSFYQGLPVISNTIYQLDLATEHYTRLGDGNTAYAQQRKGNYTHFTHLTYRLRK